MSHEYAEYTLNEGNGKSAKKREYITPQLISYGTVRDLTQAGGSVGLESGNCSQSKPKSAVCPCERRAKENIVRIGSHPLGIGLYLFDYKAEYRDAWGHGRQFGVIADEVEQVMPEAVSMHPDGYRMVNYEMLGISRTLH